MSTESGEAQLALVSAGTFGAPVRDWAPGHPLQYNVLNVFDGRITVETRRRESAEGAWKPDARWMQGPGADPLSRYEIQL